MNEPSFGMPRLFRVIAHLGSTLLALVLLAGTATAQQQFFQVACDAGLGKAFTFLLTAAAVFVIGKGIFETLMGVDKSRSRGSGKMQKQGRERMKSGVTTIFGGIFVPPLVIGMINAMGVSLDCLNPGLLV